jgi:hypothetical protein
VRKERIRIGAHDKILRFLRFLGVKDSYVQMPIINFHQMKLSDGVARMILPGAFGSTLALRTNRWAASTPVFVPTALKPSI